MIVALDASQEVDEDDDDSEEDDSEEDSKNPASSESGLDESICWL